MKTFIRAEWNLYKCNSVRMIVGIVFMALYLFSQIFCGVLPISYTMLPLLLGLLTTSFLTFPLFTGSVQVGGGKMKRVQPVESQLLCLGETKSVFLLIRFCTFVIFAVVIAVGTILFQSILFFAEREMFQRTHCVVSLQIVLSFIFLIALGTMIAGKSIQLVLPVMVGMLSGIMTGIIEEMETMEREGEIVNKTGIMLFSRYLMLGMFAAFLVTFLVRYFTSILSEKVGRED